MFSASAISPETIRAYRETNYNVHGESAFTLNVGIASPALRALYAARHIDSCAFVTACNPFSQQITARANAARQKALARKLARRGLQIINGIGQHPSGSWDGEASFLVLKLSLDAAKKMGKRLEQNAIVWCGPDAVPQLVLLR